MKMDETDMEKIMNALTGARRALGIGRQTGVVGMLAVNRALSSLERAVPAEVLANQLPKTLATLQLMQTNGGRVPERMALDGFSEVSSLRSEIAKRPRPLTDEEVEAMHRRETGVEDEDVGDASPSHAPGQS